ncbi:hypothetical protein [Microbulbifer guangxiensis]|uniref:hypothetical protein n=1 Tax=Microbulbifer guangxiensis TaxID=2904249 RepID=UPI001F3036E4|nr:hypothetical protein [Microbulbifer guangxiensis]
MIVEREAGDLERIKKCEMDAFIVDVNKYLLNRFNYKTPPARAGLGFSVIADRAKFDIYLRYKPESKFWPKDTLVIARLGFVETRKGNGKSFLKFLVSKALEFNISHLGIESVNELSRSFAMKYGFSPMTRSADSIAKTIKKGLYGERDTRCLVGGVEEIGRYIESYG